MGSVIAWRHINLLGEYDFSDERLQDSVGIKPPNRGRNAVQNLGGNNRRLSLLQLEVTRKLVRVYVRLLEQTLQISTEGRNLYSYELGGFR